MTGREPLTGPRPSVHDYCLVGACGWIGGTGGGCTGNREFGVGDRLGAAPGSSAGTDMQSGHELSSHLAVAVAV
jgi:hypothetical protein